MTTAKKTPVILASSSPRRQYLMREVGFDFTVEKPEVEETFPESLPPDRIARYLAEKKAAFFKEKISNEIVVTADTVVILHNRILNKPVDRAEAIAMLSDLAGKTHTVMTGVCIFSAAYAETFDEATHVTFEALTTPDIEFYVDTFKPFDKAGAYGAQDGLPPHINPCSPEEIDFLKSINRQDLIGKTLTVPPEDGITIINSIQGSYFNVMGLPIHKVYERLHRLL